MRKNQREGLEAIRAQRKSNAQDIMSRFTQNCDSCNAVSSKKKLFDLEEGRFCLDCLPEGMSGLEALDIHTARQAKIKEELENPVRPEDFGDWS